MGEQPEKPAFSLHSLFNQVLKPLDVKTKFYNAEVRHMFYYGGCTQIECLFFDLKSSSEVCGDGVLLKEKQLLLHFLFGYIVLAWLHSLCKLFISMFIASQS